MKVIFNFAHIQYWRGLEARAHLPTPMLYSVYAIFAVNEVTCIVENGLYEIFQSI